MMPVCDHNEMVMLHHLLCIEIAQHFTGVYDISYLPVLCMQSSYVVAMDTPVDSSLVQISL